MQDACGVSITVTANEGNTAWWLAYGISDPTTTSVQLMDSGSYQNKLTLPYLPLLVDWFYLFHSCSSFDASRYSSWTALLPTNWGFWTLTTNGAPVTFPVSLLLSNGVSQVTLTDIFTSASPGVSVNTQQSYPINPIFSYTPKSTLFSFKRIIELV